MCTCKKTNDWCSACGHFRRDCSEPCQRGMHDRCIQEEVEVKQHNKDFWEGFVVGCFALCFSTILALYIMSLVRNYF